MKIINKLLITSISISLLFFNLTYASQSSGTIISNTYSQAMVCNTTPCTPFSGNYINFKPTSGGAGYSPVTIDDTNGIDGYAFGNYLGWINFGRSGTSTVVVNTTTGVISGYAWAQNSGWINMAPTGYGVSINSSGEWTGYAWASGKNGGWIKFDCSASATSTCVKTDWVPTTARTVVTPPSGGGGGGGGGGSVAGSWVPTGSTTTNQVFSNNIQTGPQNQKNGDYVNDYRADINDSGRIDILDFNMLMIGWGNTVKLDLNIDKPLRCPLANIADINCNGKIDLLDFNLLMVYWGQLVGTQGAKFR